MFRLQPGGRIIYLKPLTMGNSSPPKASALSGRPHTRSPTYVCGMPPLCHLRFFLQEMGHQPEAASQPCLSRHSPAAALSPRASHTPHTRFHHCLKYRFLPEPKRLFSPSRLIWIFSTVAHLSSPPSESPWPSPPFVRLGSNIYRDALCSSEERFCNFVFL